MDCSPKPAKWYTWMQRDVAPAELYTSPAVRRGVFWRLVTISATPRAIQLSMYVCTKKDNSMSRNMKKHSSRTCLYGLVFVFVFQYFAPYIDDAYHEAEC